MKRLSYWKVLTTAIIVMAAAALMIGPAVAGGPSAPSSQVANPINTITVNGFGQAFGSPDVAYVQVGVDIVDKDVTTAFNQANDTMNAVVAAVKELGIAPADLRTTNINLWAEDRYNQATGDTERVYHVGNTLQVTVHDVTKATDVITAAIGAGANNVYGFSFGIADTTDLERQARVDAVADARARAGHLAEAMGVILGKPVIIVEQPVGGLPYQAIDASAYGRGGGGAPPVEQGQLSVSAELQVTFSISE